MSIVPLDLGVDDAPRQDEVLPAAEPVSGREARGSGSTEAEKTELVTFPAIRAFMVPPFCAKGSGRSVSGLTWGLTTVGGGSPKKTPVPAR